MPSPRSGRGTALAALLGGVLALATAAAAQDAATAGEIPGLRIEPITDPAVNSPKEKLRLTLFPADPKHAACTTVRVSPAGATQLDDSLDAFLKEVVAAFKAGDEKRLQPLFHPRMNVSLAAIGEVYARLANVYGPPLDVSVKQLWALNTVDGTPGGLACGAGVEVRAMYGYPLQFAVWLQVMGQRELGYIYLGIVPFDGRWNLGALHAQQWTHDGKDPAAWEAAAAADAAAGVKEAAFAKYDLAAKLLEGGSYVGLAQRDVIVKARDAVMTRAAWDQAIRAPLKEHDVIYTSTLLVIGGAGVLVRMRVPEEISVERIKTRCKQVAETLMAQPWSKGLAGVRCGFNMPKEDAAKDGALGGIYMAFDDLRPKKK